MNQKIIAIEGLYSHPARYPEKTITVGEQLDIEEALAPLGIIPEFSNL